MRAKLHYSNIHIKICEDTEQMGISFACWHLSLKHY